MSDSDSDYDVATAKHLQELAASAAEKLSAVSALAEKARHIYELNDSGNARIVDELLRIMFGSDERF